MSRYTPLAVEIYGADIRNSYPCGCQFSVNAAGVYTHYTNPDCEFDAGKVGLVQLGHHHVAFDAPTGTLLNQKTKRLYGYINP